MEEDRRVSPRMLREIPKGVGERKQFRQVRSERELLEMAVALADPPIHRPEESDDAATDRRALFRTSIAST